MAKENIQIKREPTIWENIFANDNSDKSLTSKVYKELMGLNTRKSQSNLKTGKGPEQTLLQGGYAEGPEK